MQSENTVDVEAVERTDVLINWLYRYSSRMALFFAGLALMAAAVRRMRGW